MTVEESELCDGFIKELRSDTALLIEKFGIDTTTAPVYVDGSPRYQAVSNDFEKLQHVQHTLTATSNGGEAWENTELTNRKNGNYLSEQLQIVKKQLLDAGEAKTHSYLLVDWQGTIQGVDSGGPITKAEIQSRLGGEFETDTWGVGNSVMTMCFRSDGLQSSLQTNRKFKAKSGNVLIGIKDRTGFRGLTDDERNGAIKFIDAAL